MPIDKLEQGLKPATNCEKFMNNVCYLPVNLTVPKHELNIMINRVLGIVYRYQLFAEYMSKHVNKPIQSSVRPIAHAKL